MQANLLLVAQIVSGIVTVLGYLVPKEALDRLDNWLRNWLSSHRDKADATVWSWDDRPGVLVVLILLGLPVWMLCNKPEYERIGSICFMGWCCLLFAYFVIFCFLRLCLRNILGLLRFLVWCPRGVLAGVAFLCFVVTTTIKFNLPGH